MDEDHLLDVVYTKSSRLSIELFLGYINNSFKTHQEYIHKKVEKVGYMEVLFVADLNYDHHLDLIFKYFWQDEMNIAYGYGNGSFQKHTAITDIDLSGRPLLIEDLNNDTYLDLAIGSTHGKEILVHLGKQDGSFSILPDHRVGIGLYSPQIAFADLNTDGILDLVYVADKGDFMIHLGVGDGSFHRERMHSTPSKESLYKPMPCDLNGDEMVDLVLFHFGKTNLVVMLNDGNGTFRNIGFDHVYAIDMNNIKMSDMNHDTHLDIAVMHQFQRNKIKIYYGFGNGSFAASDDIVVSRDHAIESCEVGDFNGDHRLDLVTAVDGKIILLLNDC